MKTNQIKNKYSIIAKQAVVAGLVITLVSAPVLETPKAFASDITEPNLLKLINQERTSHNLPVLKEDSDLDAAANLKAKDMINRNYFEHYAYGLTPWDFMTMEGYDYLYAGENLAMDFNTSEGMVNAWMNSPLHRANILNPDYQDIGFGVVKGAYTENGESRDTIMVSNMFGRKKPTILKIFDYIRTNIFGLF